MRWWRTAVLLLSLAAAAHAQVPLPVGPPTPPQAEPPYDPVADGQDDAIIQEMLYGTFSADEIYSSPSLQRRIQDQAGEMIAAAHRRVSRQGQRIKETKEAIDAGYDTSDSLRPMIAELQKRMQIAQYAVDRASVLKDIVEMARAERFRYSRGKKMERYDGNGIFRDVDLRIIRAAYMRRFHRNLPVSAAGQTHTHAAMGFNHAGRVDVALNPDQPEGVWLRQYLEVLGIPYYAFRAAIRGSATAPHIHIGTGSARTRRSD